jgi:hypothetical protein
MARSITRRKAYFFGWGKLLIAGIRQSGQVPTGYTEYLLDIYGSCIVIRHYANKEKVRLEIEGYTSISRESKINAY